MSIAPSFSFSKCIEGNFSYHALQKTDKLEQIIDFGVEALEALKFALSKHETPLKNVSALFTNASFFFQLDSLREIFTEGSDFMYALRRENLTTLSVKFLKILPTLNDCCNIADRINELFGRPLAFGIYWAIPVVGALADVSLALIGLRVKVVKLHNGPQHGGSHLYRCLKLVIACFATCMALLTLASLVPACAPLLPLFERSINVLLLSTFVMRMGLEGCHRESPSL